MAISKLAMAAGAAAFGGIGYAAGTSGKKKAVKKAKNTATALTTTANISKTLSGMGLKPNYENFKKYHRSPTFTKAFNKRAESNRKAIRSFQPSGMIIRFNNSKLMKKK